MVVKKNEHAAVLSKTVIAVAIAGCLMSRAAIAQDRELEEIIVTAERRVNTEATTAISVEVLTDTFIAENQIKDIIDLQNAVPALQFFQNGSYVQANSRGVGNPSTGGPSEQVGVPVFFDGATQGEEMGIASGFFDLAGIEVLRGPQATFVGQAAAGGAILINSARPDFDGLGGFVELTGGTYGQRKLMGALNLPVSENFAARVAYMSEVRDSFYTNETGGQVPGASSQWTPGDQQDQNFRLSLLWEPSEKLSIWGKLEQSELHTYGAPLQPNPRFYVGFWDNDGNPATPSLPVRTYSTHLQGPDATTATPNGTGGFLPGVNNRPGPNGVV
jgi:iron complex outermembrane receptor protein